MVVCPAFHVALSLSDSVDGVGGVVVMCRRVWDAIGWYVLGLEDAFVIVLVYMVTF